MAVFPLGVPRQRIAKLIRIRAILPLLLLFLLAFFGSRHELGRSGDTSGRMINEFDESGQPEGQAVS